MSCSNDQPITPADTFCTGVSAFRSKPCNSSSSLRSRATFARIAVLAMEANRPSSLACSSPLKYWNIVAGIGLARIRCAATPSAQASKPGAAQAGEARRATARDSAIFMVCLPWVDRAESCLVAKMKPLEISGATGSRLRDSTFCVSSGRCGPRLCTDTRRLVDRADGVGTSHRCAFPQGLPKHTGGCMRPAAVRREGQLWSSLEPSIRTSCLRRCRGFQFEFCACSRANDDKPASA